MLVLEGEGAAAEGKSVVCMHEDSMGMQARKLLCAMMAIDHFFVSAGLFWGVPEHADGQHA